MKKIHMTKRYARQRIKNPKYFDKKSLRIKDVGRPKHTKIIVGCKKGKYDSKKRRCKIGTEVQSVLFDRKDFLERSVKLGKDAKRLVREIKKQKFYR